MNSYNAFENTKTELPRYRKFDWLYFVKIANQIGFCLYCVLQDFVNFLYYVCSVPDVTCCTG